MSGAPVRLATTLSLTSVVMFGLAYMAPSLVVVIFGIISAASSGAATTAFALSTGAILLTALSYAKMARHYPVSGSAYTYARRLLGSPVGFLVGWGVLLDYLFLPMVAWLTQALYLNASFPQVPVWAWILLNAALTSSINIAGVVLADRVNRLLTIAAVTLVVVFAAYCLVYLGHHHPASYSAPVWNEHSTVTGISAAAAIAAYSYLGFDAVTTLSEETRDAARTIPRAVVLVVAIGGTLFVAVSYVMQLVHPGGQFADEQIAAYAMSVQIGGQAFADWQNLASIVAGFGSCLAVQLSSSRLLYIMGRDGVLPGRVFGLLNARTKTPVVCILLTGAMCLIGLGLSLETATSFINFGAFTAFTAVNICTIAYFVRNRRGAGVGVLGYVVVPVLAACVTVYMITQLSAAAITMGVSWMIAGAVYLVWLTRGFRRPTPELGMDAPEADGVRTSGS
ncbi:APC family permease [Pseudonocardia acaciae]|uniref:APC family permease n=1 Tax=Pseudonocardia acaciae TaxID=551276 RepID=UPI000565428D|nr:APC family permease [Pseudonocardia acaciae]